MERKLATVLFVDLVDSTGLLARSDPEVVRRRVNRFFEHVSECIEKHGGIVEKFAGDAVMAAFGIPQAHEDDALRAVRAALAILEDVRTLGLEARVGIEAGEVVAERTEATFATGEPVNVAARLQQAAKPGQILVGPSAHRLTLGRAQTEDVGPLQLRGLPEAVWTWEVLGIEGRGAGRRLAEAPLVGRQTEIELLENTFRRALRDRRAHLFTIYGEPGVGKTRLAQEFLASLEDITVLTGRSLPYGEGITYWPLAEMVKAAAGIADDDPLDVALEKLRVCCPAEAVADLLGLASGVLEAVQGERGQQEIAWAAREWAEKLAEAQPLVLVFEDIHWAEEPLLELIEHLADWIRDTPLLLLTLARPELLDVRSGWGGGRLRATAIELEPLGPRESEELVDALVDAGASRPLPDNVRRALLDKTEGNPLFVEETVRMLAEQAGNGDGGSVERIPDTIQALIAARIDRLPAETRLALQRAAVVGRIFWAGAIERLSPEIEDVECALEDLLLRDFVQREPRSTITGETAYRFKHVLIREVAYGGLAKSARAAHHEGFAAWLAERAGEELLEIRAFHLDRASELHAELDGAPPGELAAAAAAALEAAGRRALAREAYRSARTTLLRAVELEPTLERRWLAARAASRLGDFPAVSAEMEAVRAAAERAGEAKIQGRALTALADVALFREADAGRARDLADAALAVLADVDHVDSRFEAATARSCVSNFVGDPVEEEGFLREALRLAQHAGRKDLETTAIESLASMYLRRLDLSEAEPLVRRAMELADESGSVHARAQALQTLGFFHGLRGELDEAEAELQGAYELSEEIGHASDMARALNELGTIAESRGDDEAAERRWRKAIKILKPLGERGFLCESQRRLAQLLARNGKLEEAERLALEARQTVGPEDAVSQITTTMALGVVRAAQGRGEEAEELLHSSVEAFERSVFRFAELVGVRTLAQFLREQGRDDEAAPYEARVEELSAPLRSAARIA